MSGIAAIAAAPGEQIDEAHFRRWVQALASHERRASLWIAPNAGLAAALGNPYHDWPFADAPLTVDGAVWIVADARVDAQYELIRELRAAGQNVRGRTSDSELILRAYLVWGTDCAAHLLGDFAFIVWDSREQRLFAVRDRFGARQLYLAPIHRGLLVSSNPNALFRHPGVDRAVNEETIAGFLVHNEMGADDATAFVGIQRVPPAHSLVWERGVLRTSCYWTAPIEAPMRLASKSDYPAQFWDLVRNAAEDASRGGPVGVLLSGGLDSPMLAAALQQTASAGHVSGHTMVWQDLMPDVERPFAEGVAALLGIEWQTHPYDAFLPFERSEQVQLAQPVPDGSPFSIDTHELFNGIARHARVAVTGLGPDAFLRGEAVLPRLVAGPERMRTAAGALAYAFRERKRPPLGIRPWISARKPAPRYPSWLPKRIVELAAGIATRGEERRHPHRPYAYRLTTSSYWAKYLEWYAGTARASGVSCAHPFFDVRVVAFALRLPAVPWAWDKQIQRESAAGHLPAEVVTRRKTPLIRDRLMAYTEKHGLEWIGAQSASACVAPYFRGSEFAELADTYRRQPGWIHIRPLCLDRFLRAWNEQTVIR